MVSAVISRELALPENPSAELAASLVWQCCQPTLSVIPDNECALPKLLRWKPPSLDFAIGSSSANACPLAEFVDGENALERLLSFLLIHVAPDWKFMVLDIELQGASC
ncbi:hypothetical protein [Undibacterium sp. WLHG33]|uniref:hypothetical protein n=1 Tax=Undibacterium sp. WLHG33 TaxID=3412482 RepID=UPI003C2F3B5B